MRFEAVFTYFLFVLAGIPITAKPLTRRVNSKWFVMIAGSIAVLEEVPAEHEACLHTRRDGQPVSIGEYGALRLAVHTLNVAEFGRNAHRSLYIRDIKNAITLKTMKRPNPTLQKWVLFAGRYAAPIEVAAHIFDAKRAIPAIPGSTVPSAVLNPKERGRLQFRMAKREPEKLLFGVHGCRPRWLAGLGLHDDLQQIAEAAAGRISAAIGRSGLPEDRRHAVEALKLRAHGQ